jgi:RHS repeat-associated protein
VTEGNGSNSSSIDWSYDDAYRLLSETNNNSAGTPILRTTYSYDSVGNRLTMGVGVGTPITTTYSYNVLDQLVTAGNAQYYYDNRGNLIRVNDGSNQTNYQWDAADRLRNVTVPGGGSASYSYDADGRRVKQVSGATTSNYLWDETSTYGDVVLETDGSGAIQTSYVLGDSELLSQKKGTSAPNYFLKDGQGSVRNLVDGSGTLISGQSYTYDAFGKLLSGQTSPASNYLYTGQQFDPLSGLYSLRARYYSPGDSRFLSLDPNGINIKDPIELNYYGYVANNPVNNYDPSGKSLVEQGWLQKIQIVAKEGLKQVAEEVVEDAILELLSNQLRPWAETLWNRAVKKITGQPDIVVGFGYGMDQNGNPKFLLSVNDFDADNEAYRRNKPAVDELREFAEKNGWVFAGGDVDPDFPLHAEGNMAQAARKAKLNPNLPVVAAISENPNGICRRCQTTQLVEKAFKKGAGIILKAIPGAKGRIFIAAKRLEP